MLQFIVEVVGAGASVIVIADWITGKFKGRVSKFTINRREVDLNDDGSVRRIVEEEIKLRRE